MWTSRSLSRTSNYREADDKILLPEFEISVRVVQSDNNAGMLSQTRSWMVFCPQDVLWTNISGHKKVQWQCLTQKDLCKGHDLGKLCQFDFLTSINQLFHLPCYYRTKRAFSYHIWVPNWGRITFYYCPFCNILHIGCIVLENTVLIWFLLHGRYLSYWKKNRAPKKCWTIFFMGSFSILDLKCFTLVWLWQLCLAPGSSYLFK